MTTIAYKDGVMAADRQVSNELYLQKSHSVKIQDIDGMLVGTCGNCIGGNMFMAWFRDEVNDDEAIDLFESDADYEAIVVDEEGIWIYDHLLNREKIDMPYYAVGSGSKVAMALMEAGHDAETAVRIAMNHDLYSGGKLDLLKRKT